MMYRHSRACLSIAVVLVVASVLSGCAGAVIGAGATAATAAMEERGISGVASDTATATQIRGKLVERGGNLALRVGVEVYGKRALLTGIVDSEQDRADAVRLAWSVEGIEDVLNEIEIGDPSLLENARDGLITARLFGRMTGDAEILAINYSIETVNGVIYLIGTAQSADELKRVINHAREVKNARRVVNHVRVKPANKS